MAKILKKYTKQKKKPGPRPKYPWDKWFDGKIRLLVHGEDFTCSILSMEDNVRKAARRADFQVIVHQEDNGIVIEPAPEK